MTAYSEELRDIALDALDESHAAIRHVHAAECCMMTGLYVHAVLDASVPILIRELAETPHIHPLTREWLISMAEAAER